jgi:hypothetical protein
MKAWRILVVLFSCLCSGAAFGQGTLWRNFDTSIKEADPRPIAALSAARRAAIEKFAVRSMSHDIDCSAAGDLAGWQESLTFLDVPVGGRRVTFVAGECPPSMEVSGLVVWNGTQPRSVVAPQQLGCWFHRVQPQVSYGLHDFTMGCHRSAFATDYDWYRFDGKVYRRISAATAYERDGLGRQLMAEDRKQCEQMHQKCNLMLYSPNDRSASDQ